MPGDGSEKTFLDRLRGESRQGVGRGLQRMARLVRGGAGLAQTLLARSKQGAESPLSERDLAKLEVLVARLGDLKGLPMKLGQMIAFLDSLSGADERGAALEAVDLTLTLLAHLEVREAGEDDQRRQPDATEQADEESHDVTLRTS